MIHTKATAAWRIGMACSAALLLAACGRTSEEAGAPSDENTTTAQTEADAGACAPAGELHYICGPQNAEDLVRLGDSQWLIASGMGGLGQDVGPGRVYLVNHRDKTYEEWFPADQPAFNHDREMFGACPGPVDPSKFSPHGLAIREESQNRYRLYMTSHGAREAIEVFDIDTSNERPTITWAGCVVLPEKTFANSVAILSDGGFVTTKMMDPTVPDAFAQINAGEISGNVYEWHPGGKVTAVPGTELSGANGIALSPDQRWMYVAAFGAPAIVRFDRQARPMTKQSAVLDIRADNLRWSADGKLYTVGGHVVAPAMMVECANPPCSTGWSVVEIDPDSLQARRVAGVDQTAALQGASTALPVGDEIWIGTYSGDRIGYMPAEDHRGDR